MYPGTRPKSRRAPGQLFGKNLQPYLQLDFKWRINQIPSGLIIIDAIKYTFIYRDIEEKDGTLQPGTISGKL